MTILRPLLSVASGLTLVVLVGCGGVDDGTRQIDLDDACEACARSPFG
jgi:hypothetical protein